MKIKITLFFILALLMSLSAVWSNDDVLSLTETFYNMGTANEYQVRAEAGNLRTQYANAPEEVPSYATFDGYFVPDSNNTKVAIFSDDGVDVYVDGVLVHATKDMGQHLPSLDQSFHVLSQNWVAGRTYHIRIEYSNICYTGEFDIDGCTMFAYDDGGAVYDEPPIEVTLSLSKSDITTCESVTVTAIATDTDIVNGSPISDSVNKFTWYIDGVHYSQGDDLSEITLTFSSPGSRTISVVADESNPLIDDSSATASAQVGVDSNSEPPVIANAMCSLSVNGPWQGNEINVQAGTTVYFSGDCAEAPSYDKDIAYDCSEIDDSIYTYSWDFGDTYTGSGAEISHTYTGVSQYVSLYVVSLVADDAGLVFDDPESAPSQITVRVFETVPPSPTVTCPSEGELYNGLSPLVSWDGQLHDKFQVRILTVDDPNGTTIWDSGEVSSEDSQAICGSELSEQTTYYVFVREHNLMGWGAWSSTGHDFTVKTPLEPENVYINWSPTGPTFVCGDSITCTATYSEPSNWENIDHADLLIDESSLDELNACYLRYRPSSGECWLADEDGMFTIGGEDYTPGSNNILENDEVIVDLSNTTITAIPGTTNIAISWNLQFKKAFSGPKSVALSVVNNAGMKDPDNPEVFSLIDIVGDGLNSEITSPDNCAYINSSTVTISGEAFDSDTECISSVQISVDGCETWLPATLDSGQGTRTWSYIWENAENGTYTVKSRAINCDDVVEEPGTGIKLTIDTAPPISTITSPANGASISGETVEISGRTFDYNGKVVKVELRFDAGNWQEVGLSQNGESFWYSYAIPETSDGTPLTIQSRATDAAGNVEIPSDDITITVTYEQLMLRLGETVTPEPLPDINTSLFESQKTLKAGPYSILNLCNGMLLTEIPFTGWTSVGKLAVDFRVYHQPHRTSCPTDIKDRWMHSYESVLTESTEKVTIYHPQGNEDIWKPGTYYFRLYDTEDCLEKDGTNGFIVTGRKDHISYYYEHAIGDQKWMLSKIKDTRGNEITFEYDSTNPVLLKWIKDPDSMRSLLLCWNKVGSDKHDALVGVYTSWGFGSEYRQLYWLKYDSSGNMTSIEFPHDMSSYGQGTDTPYIPAEATTLRDTTYLSAKFSQQPIVNLFFSYDNTSASRLKVNKITSIKCGSSLENNKTLVGISYAFCDSAYLFQNGCYTGTMEITEGNASTKVKFTNPQGHCWDGPCMRQNYDYYGGTTTVVWPSGSTTTYDHRQWMYKDYAEKNNCNNWIGYRIWKVDTTATINGKSLSKSEIYNWSRPGYKQDGETIAWYHGTHLLSYVNPKGKVSNFDWNPQGDLQTATNPLGEVTVMTYDGYDLETVTDPAGKLTRYTYDPTYRELTRKQVDPNGLNITTDYGYSDDGDVTSVTGPYYGSSSAGAPVTDYEYENGLITKSTDPVGRYVEARYTGLGVKYWESKPRIKSWYPAAPTIWIYDKAGRPFYTWSSGDMETITDYNSQGLVMQTTDASGCLTTQTYCTTGEPYETTRYNKDSSGWLKASQYYDSARNHITTEMQDETSAHMRSFYEYNQLNQLSTVRAIPTSEFSDVPVVSYEYDPNGKLSLTTNGRGNTIKIEYDDADRPTLTTYSDGKADERTYYPVGYPNAGRLYQIKEGTSASRTAIRTYDTYDGAGRLTDETRNDLNRKIHHAYDAAGRKTQIEIRDMSSTPLVTYDYQYYLDGKLKQIDYTDHTDSSDTKTTTIEYTDPYGRLTKCTYPNGTVAYYGYQKTGPTGAAESRDLFAWVVNKSPNGNVLSQRSYTYDELANIKTISDRSFKTTYTYDDFGRLVDERRTGTYPYEYTYAYDPMGNRLTKTVVGSYISEYTNDADSKLMATTNPDVTYHYDEDGNRTEKITGEVTTTYTYDILNRLIHISSPATTYKYNSLGERYEATRSGTINRFLYVDGKLLQELDTSGNVLVAYNPGIFEIKNSSILYYEHDLQGSTISATNGSGVLRTHRFVYGAYGESIDVYTSTRYKYGAQHGYYSDAWGTDLIKTGARYYDPTIGRFLTKDPARDGANWYAYCGDNPVGAVDPSGLHHLVFGGEKLKLFEDGGTLTNSWPAFSGQPGYGAASCVGNEGSIPPGEYFIRPDTFYYYTTNLWKDAYLPYTFGAPDKSGETLASWGNARTRIYPANMEDFLADNPNRKGTFYIHGGKYVGSIGCIDVGPNDLDVAKTLSSLYVPTAAFGFVEHETVRLTVDYSGWNGTVPGTSYPGITWDDFLH